MKITKLPNSEIEIDAEISLETLVKAKVKALKKINKSAKIDGFREGHIPEKIIVEKFGEMYILEESAEIAISEEYAKIIDAEKLNPIGHPQVTITKIAIGSPISFKLKTAVVPEVTLADYKKIASAEMKKEESVEPTEKEIDAVLLEIRKEIKRREPVSQNLEKEADEILAKEEHDHSDHEGHDHAHDHKHEEGEDKKSKKAEKEVELDLPEFNAETLKKIGDFKDIEDLKKQVKENLIAEKTRKNKDKKRFAILEGLVEKSKMELPEILVESEIEKMIVGMKDDIMRYGLKYEDYLKEIKKTEEDLKKEMRPNALKKAKTQLILNKIALDEKIIPSNEEIDAEVKMILSQYKDADPLRAKIYVETLITNEKVLNFLEEQK